MLTQRVLTTKTKESSAKKANSAQTSPRKQITATKSLVGSKASTNDKSDKKDIQPDQHGMQSKRLLRLDADDYIDVNHTNNENNTSELSIIKLLEEQIEKEALEEKAEKKFQEEINLLKKDLAMKNVLVEKLMKENKELRTEMDELLSTMEEAKDNINSKLIECNQRIQELEDIIKKLQDENKQYKSIIEGNNPNLNKQDLAGIEKSVGKYYDDANQRIDVFQYQMIEQFAKFIEESKKQYENVNSLLQIRIEESKNMNRTEEPEKAGTTNIPQPISHPYNSRVLPNASQTRSKTTSNPVNLGLNIALNTEPSERYALPPYTNKTRRHMTSQNLHDIAATVMTETYLNDTSRRIKSPKSTFTPKTKPRQTFRV